MKPLIPPSSLIASDQTAIILPRRRGARIAAALVTTFVVAAHIRAAGPNAVPLVAVTNPPSIQMLVPGFAVRELPLHLNNINNLVYAPDGRLFALCYDGNVWQLKDTDGDGLEDAATPFFNNEKNEIKPSIGMAWGPGGLYIASRGCVLRLRDKGDGTADLETIASGWVPPTGQAGSSLDAIGLAVDAAGNVFFGLGCDKWNEAYRVNKDNGKSDYDIHSERGTVLKLSPDGKKREAIATGLRFTVSLAFNAAGDLFCTDQEGATWLSNGNPFDELLHIQPGRHYGFPPRHPKYLPDVIDEPSVFDYGPQHQSTCGLHFIEPTGGGKNIFGPAWWRGDAIISGESRGKLWRTKLVKTPAGYVAQNDLIACLGMLTVDAVPTPQGDLLVTCHSGEPDWGTGPQGKGKLYKISNVDKTAPQPVLAYAASPTETRVVFDRPLDPLRFKNLAKHSGVTMGVYVSAGDRFETFRPGYQAVRSQMQLPRYELPVLSAGITPDNCALILQTTPRTVAMNYAVSLPEGPDALRPRDPRRRDLPQHAAIDVLTDLTGVEAEWRDADGKVQWSGWLPHPDLTVSREFTAASEEHAKLFQLLKNRGSLTLRGQLDLWYMLRAQTQPISKLDFSYPPEVVTVELQASGAVNVETGLQTTVERMGDRKLRIRTEPGPEQWFPVTITLATGGAEPRLDVNWFTAEDARPRALPLRRVLLPWAKHRTEAPPEIAEGAIPEIAGGDWARGKTVFFGEQVACFKCHQANGQGGTIGPDLSNLIQRDYASVVRDIAQPSAAINPDHIAFSVKLKNGEMENGVVLSDTPESVVLGRANGTPLTIPKNQITAMSASTVSLMPDNLWQLLNEQQRCDLLTFLMTAPPKNNSR